MSTFGEEFSALLQPVYAELLRRNSIPTGDISPGEALAMDRAEQALADVVEAWIAHGRPHCDLCGATKDLVTLVPSGTLVCYDGTACAQRLGDNS